MPILLGLRDELANALKVIKAECASHGISCRSCPLWIGDGTVAQRCGLNVYNGRFMDCPSDWEIGEDDLAQMTHAQMIEMAKAGEPVYAVETWRHKERTECWVLLNQDCGLPFAAVDACGSVLWDCSTYDIGGTSSWVAYDHKPTERERAFIPWEGEENG